MRTLRYLAVGLFVTGCGAGEPDPQGGPDARDGDAPLPDGPDGEQLPGDVLWKYPYALQVELAPTIAPDGTIIVQGKDSTNTPTDGPTVVAIDRAGALRWSAVTNPGAIPAPPATVVDDLVLVPASTRGGSLDGRIHRYRLADGMALDPVVLTGPITDGLAIGANGTIYAPATPLQAIAPGATTPTWSYAMTNGGKTGSNAAVGPSGTIYVGGRGTAEHNLHAVNPDGTEKWVRDLGNAVIDPIAIDEQERVYTVTSRGKLFAYDADGTVAWTYQFDSGTSGGGIAIGPDRTIYVGTTGPTPGSYTGEYLFALREGANGQGELVWRKLVGLSWVSATPALSASGTLYVTDFCRTIIAVRASDGEKLWDYVIPELSGEVCAGFSAPRIAPDGTVYAWNEGLSAGAGGGLYAFRGDGSGPAASAWPQEGRDPAHRGHVAP